MPENNSNPNIIKRIPTKTGMVVSDKMDKTIVVRIDRTTKHSLYNKVTKKSNRVTVHDEKNVAKTGDKVRIRGTRPLSKNKVWSLVKIIDKGE